MDDIEFVRRLMRENYKAVGLIPLGAIVKAYNRSRVFIHVVNGERVGYLLSGPIRRGQDVTIWQICIDKNKRGMGYGKNLFKRFYDFALNAGASGIRLRCADDIQANLFWESLGFKKMTTIAEKGRKNTYLLSLK
ncbi:MAG: GNAT family N-acetyltransferase [Actinobacteria bacterium]|nr:GNAT family N-acetyltransferase [Actinomycetota bacterium]